MLDSGKTPAFEPYGKIATKIGEFSQLGKFKKQYPEIDFDIYLPSLEENTSAMIDASIVNEEEMNRQVFSLLMLNKFAAPQSGLQTSGAVGASYSELLANQLTNLLSKSKVSEYVEIGVNEIKSDELEVAVSKSFFNDRVVVSGNIGSSSNQNEVQSQSSSVVGDFNIEYVVIYDEDGKVLFKDPDYIE